MPAAGHVQILEEEMPISREEIGERLRTAFGSADYTPPELPKVAMRILELSRRPDVSMPDVVRLLEGDPMLAGKVLKIAQSPLYAARGNIRSLDQAAMRLGLRGLRDLVFETAMGMRVFRADGYAESMELLRRHSSAVAHCARTVAMNTAFDAEFAFLCGLLHDVGMAGCLLVMGDGRDQPDLGAAWPEVDAIHERASEVMARCWELPAEVQLVIAHHHQLSIQGYDHPVVAMLVIAEALAEAHGYHIIGRTADGAEILNVDGTPQDRVHKAEAVLSLSDRDLDALLEKTGQVLSQID